MKKTIISVIGEDQVGIIAKVSEICSSHKVNIIDISQSIMQELFVMVMMTDIENMNCSLTKFKDELKKLGDGLSLDIRVMHQDLFKSMHNI